MEEARRTDKGKTVELMLRLQHLTDPDIHSYVSELKSQYGTYAMPVEELRRQVDASMGETTLTDVLYEMRQESV